MQNNQIIKPLVLTALGVFSVFSSQAKKSAKPNVIVIYVDDLGYGCLSCYGATKVSTPNIDKLAAEGRIFSDMHSASAVSTPSRYAMLTGEYPFRKNIYRPAGYATELLINEDKLTLADVMKSSGYATAIIGKWHLGFGTTSPNWNKPLKPGPLELGFDYYYGIPCVNSGPPFVFVEGHNVVGYKADDPFVLGKVPKTKVYPAKKVHNKIGGADSAHALYDDEMLGTTFAEKSVKWIQENKKNPFFLYLATTNIHNPLTPHPRFQGTSEAGLFGDFIHELDWMIGEVMGALKDAKIDDNTLVIFTSDNGAMLNWGGFEAEKKGLKINGDLFGYKFDSWEGGHRVPMIVRWPGRVKKGTKSDQLISSVDFLHSLAALVGYKLGENDAVDSYNMLPVLLGETHEQLREELVVCSNKVDNTAYRRGDWLYITGRGGGGFATSKPGSEGFGGAAAANYFKKPNSDMVNGKYKKDAPTVQLYNLKDDLAQSKNVTRENSEITNSMSERLKAIKQSSKTR